MAMKNSINLYAPYFSLLILLASLVAVALNPNLFEPTIIKIPCRLQEENTSCECSKTDSSAFAMITTTFNGNLDIYKTNASGTKAFEDLQNSYGGGFLQVAHNSTFAPGWGVSMLHGLHCLQMIRSSLFPEEYSENEHSPDSSHHQHAALNHDHITHCIGYLAQVSSRPVHTDKHFLSRLTSLSSRSCVRAMTQ